MSWRGKWARRSSGRLAAPRGSPGPWPRATHRSRNSGARSTGWSSASTRASPRGGRRLHSEESADPASKAIFYGGRRLLFEVEPLAYDTWRNEPAFSPGGLARVFVDPAARDLSSLFCALSDEGARWLILPGRRPLTDETIGQLLRALIG